MERKSSVPDQAADQFPADRLSMFTQPYVHTTLELDQQIVQQFNCKAHVSWLSNSRRYVLYPAPKRCGKSNLTKLVSNYFSPKILFIIANTYSSY